MKIRTQTYVRRLTHLNKLTLTQSYRQIYVYLYIYFIYTHKNTYTQEKMLQFYLLSKCLGGREM